MNNIVTKRLLISLGSLIFALGFQYLCNPRDFLDLDDFGFWIFVILGFIIYWTIVRIIIWVIAGYKLNTHTGITKLIVSLASIAVALGVQYLIDPYDFLDFDDEDFWLPVTFAFAGYWAIVRTIIWIIDGYKLDTNTGNTKLLISFPAIAIALGVQYLLEPRDFLDFDDFDFWLPVISTLIIYWAIIRIIIWVIDGYKTNTKTGETKLVIALASIVVTLTIPYIISMYRYHANGTQSFIALGMLSFIEYWILIVVITLIIDNKHKIDNKIIKLILLITAFILILFISMLILNL